MLDLLLDVRLLLDETVDDLLLILKQDLSSDVALQVLAIALGIALDLGLVVIELGQRCICGRLEQDRTIVVQKSRLKA